MILMCGHHLGCNLIGHLTLRLLSEGGDVCSSQAVIVLFHYGQTSTILNVPPNTFSHRQWTDLSVLIQSLKFHKLNTMTLAEMSAKHFCSCKVSWMLLTFETSKGQRTSDADLCELMYAWRMFLPDSQLLSLLQVCVPPQHRHYHPLLLLRQVAQVDHGSSSSKCVSQRASVRKA